jgi:hypothetical protein
MIGSVLPDKTSVLHWLICMKCHLENKGELLDYARKCWWLLTRGNTIFDLHTYNATAIERIYNEGNIPANLPPSMSYLQSRGDSLACHF